MPNRIIREGFLDSDAISALSDGAETLFVRLMLVADDFGRFDARPAYIRVRCYPMKPVSEAEVYKRIRELHANRLVLLYSVNSKPYLEILNFKQRTRAQKSKWPAPEDGGISEPASEKGGEPDAPEPRSPASNSGSAKRMEAKQIAIRVVNYLNEKAGTAYRTVDGTLRLPIARVVEGATEENMRAVIDMKVAQANRGEFDRKFLRPETLFNATKFESYFGQLALVSDAGVMSVATSCPRCLKPIMPGDGWTMTNDGRIHDRCGKP